MNEVVALWGQWLRPSAGLPTVQWSILLALAAVAGHLVQRYLGLPKVLGYSVIGAFAGLAGFTGAVWPLDGIGLYLVELGVAVVLFEAGGRIPLRWFRHNPMVLVQSLLESFGSLALVFWALRLMGVPVTVAEPIALIAMAASPAVLMRVVLDTGASGPMTERAMVLSTLSTLYALVLTGAQSGLIERTGQGLIASLSPAAVVLGISLVVGAALALALRLALRVMSPNSENTSILLLALIAVGTALAARFGGSAPLAALLGGMLLRQTSPRPWAWPRQLGTASSLLTMLMFVLVSVVAAQAEWSRQVAGTVLALVAARLVAKFIGVALGNAGSGTSWKQALWVGCTMSPMSSIALLLTVEAVAASPQRASMIAAIALPTILLMEMLGSVIATVAIHQAGESSQPWVPVLVRSALGDGNEP